MNEPYLPVVDSGAGPHHNLQTGKVYAASTISNGNATTAAFAMASANPESCCIPGPSNSCIDSGDPSFLNFSLFEHYGYDPAFSEEPFDELKPENATDKEFFWFKQFPSNQHYEYEGMILRGHMLANQYLRAFSPMWANLTSDLEVDDAMVLFPWNECSGKDDLSSDNVCWINLQNIALTPLDCPNDSMCGVRCLLDRVIGFAKRVFKFLRSLINF